MPRIKKVKTEEVNQPTNKSVSVVEVDGDGNERVIRTYDVTSHGEEFLKLAKQFADKLTAGGGEQELKPKKVILK